MSEQWDTEKRRDQREEEDRAYERQHLEAYIEGHLLGGSGAIMLVRDVLAGEWVKYTVARDAYNKNVKIGAMPSVTDASRSKMGSERDNLYFASEAIVDAMRECESFRDLIYDLAIEQGYVDVSDVL